jgi:hypothetical protein
MAFVCGSVCKKPAVHLVVLFYYFISYFLTLLNYWFFLGNERTLIGNDFVQAYLAMNVIGIACMLLLGSPWIFMAYYFGSQLNYRQRRNATVLGLVISFVFHDFALWVMDFYVVWNYGWIHLLQGTSFVLLCVSATVGFFGLWLGYAWKVSKILQQHFSANAFAVSYAGGPAAVGGLQPAFGGLGAGDRI